MSSSLLAWLDRYPDLDDYDNPAGDTIRGEDYLLVLPLKAILARPYWDHDGSGGGEPLAVSASDVADRLDRYSFEHGVENWQSDGVKFVSDLRRLPKGAVVYFEWKV